MSSKLKRGGSSSETTTAAAATTPRPSPREGAVKVSQAMGGRGLVEEGEEELQMVAAWWKGKKRRKRSSSVKEGRCKRCEEYGTPSVIPP